MRAATRRKIDACHAEIARLVEMEKAHHDRTHPGEAGFLRHINHCKIEFAAESPQHRDLMEATLTIHPGAMT